MKVNLVQKYLDTSKREILEKDVREEITKVMHNESLTYDDFQICIEGIISQFNITNFSNKTTGSQWGKVHRGTDNAGKGENNEWWNTSDCEKTTQKII